MSKFPLGLLQFYIFTEILFGVRCTLMIYKSLNGLVPEYLSSKFLKRIGMHYPLRDSENKLFVSLP